MFESMLEEAAAVLKLSIITASIDDDGSHVCQVPVRKCQVSSLLAGPHAA